MSIANDDTTTNGENHDDDTQTGTPQQDGASDAGSTNSEHVSDAGHAAGTGEGVPKDKPTQEESDLHEFEKGLQNLEEKQGKHQEKKPDTAKGDSAATADKKTDPKNKSAVEQPKQDAKTKDPDVEKEVAALRLQGRAAERFHEMAAEIKEARPVIENLKSLGIDNPAALNHVMKEAARGLEWEKAATESTAQPEQFKSAMLIIKAMNTGDPKQQRMAADAMFNEVKAVYKHLGVEIPGVLDPLEGHSDLQKAVEAMDITREHALELAQARAHRAGIEARDANNARTAQNTQQAQQIEQQERQRLDALSDTLKASDPHFEHKMAELTKKGEWGRIAALPAAQRYDAIVKAYRSVPNPVAQTPAPARVRPSKIVERGGAQSATRDTQPTFKSDLEAFEYGLQHMNDH